MKKRINALIFFILLSLPVIAGTQDSVFHAKPDTLKVRLRSFDQQTITDFKSDSDFRYGRPQEGLTPWERFLIWVSSMLARFLYYTTQTTLGKIFLYLACAALILWVALKLLNVELKDLFYRSSASRKMDFKLMEENIHALDFEKLIDEAVTKQQYRDAVRLVFLFSLKKLSEAHLIQWVPGKTNDEYLHELKQHPALSRVQELRYYFDYAWYGHFEINAQTYSLVNITFQEFKSKLA